MFHHTAPPVGGAPEPFCTAIFSFFTCSFASLSFSGPLDCGYDGGDCCKSTCRGGECGKQGYKCKDSSLLSECKVETIWIGDGWCDYDVEGYNIKECHFDGGDCCADTCVGRLCGANGFHCATDAGT
jgi:hypothetical protein